MKEACDFPHLPLLKHCTQAKDIGVQLVDSRLNLSACRGRHPVEISLLYLRSKLSRMSSQAPVQSIAGSHSCARSLA